MAEQTWTIKVCPECGNHRTEFVLCEHQIGAVEGAPLDRSKFVPVEVVPAALLAIAVEALGEIVEKERDYRAGPFAEAERVRTLTRQTLEQIKEAQGGE